MTFLYEQTDGRTTNVVKKHLVILVNDEEKVRLVPGDRVILREVEAQAK